MNNNGNSGSGGHSNENRYIFDLVKLALKDERISYTLFVLLFVGGLFSIIQCSKWWSKIEVENKPQKPSYREVVKDLDFEKAHDILYDYHNAWMASKNNKWSDETKRESQYYTVLDYIYKAEVQYLLNEFEEDECNTKLMLLLDEIPIEGDKVKEGLYISWKIPGDYEQYQLWTKHFNAICNTILSTAIALKKQSIAEKIISRYADAIEVIDGEGDEGKGKIKVNGIKVDKEHSYLRYIDKDRAEAQKKYNEAVESGVFNE